jgi:hypothetical protein
MTSGNTLDASIVSFGRYIYLWKSLHQTCELWLNWYLTIFLSQWSWLVKLWMADLWVTKERTCWPFMRGETRTASWVRVSMCDDMGVTSRDSFCVLYLNSVWHGNLGVTSRVPARLPPTKKSMSGRQLPTRTQGGKGSWLIVLQTISTVSRLAFSYFGIEYPIYIGNSSCCRMSQYIPNLFSFIESIISIFCL